MARKDAVVLRRLEELPNIGPRMARDLLRLGVRSKEDLRKRTGRGLYEAICRLDGRPRPRRGRPSAPVRGRVGVRHDPCVLDTFEAVTVFAKGGPDLPWWHYSRVRKKGAAARANDPRRGAAHHQRGRDRSSIM